MKIKILKIYLLLTSLSLLYLVGCSTVTSNAGKTLSTGVITVDKAMQGWATWVVIHGTSEQNQINVRAAYKRYQDSIRVAKIAYADLATANNRTSWENAEKVLNNAIAVFLLTIDHAKVNEGPPMLPLFIPNGTPIELHVTNNHPNAVINLEKITK